MDRNTCLNNIENSFTFQMSLGSKELFHSNFLHWLSFIDWDGFLKVLHELSGVEQFWWEDPHCGVEASVGAGKQPFRPENGNIEVRREYNHYDLSIYILVGFTNPRKSGKPAKKWQPVFVLENKVKSMPYQKQLDDYANKVYEEWEKSLPVNNTWQNQGITALLLTLFDGITISPSNVGNNNTLPWNVRNYQQLKSVVSQISDKEKTIIDDYCTFIEALHHLSQTDDWMVSENDDYVNKMIGGGDEEKRLRISDLREKVHFERMLKIFEEKVKKSSLKDNCEHSYKGHAEKGKVYYETAFSRGTGIFQPFIIINDDYWLMIQLQGHQYRRCVITNKKDDAKMASIINKLKQTIWPGYDPQCEYGDCFKYDYSPFDNKTVGEVLDKVIEDFENIISHIDELKKIP
jgi:hypothetical protein